MDVKYITPFVVSFNSVMPQFGFKALSKGVLQAKKRTFKSSGIITIVGVSGQMKGNVVYTIANDDAEKIASVMKKGISAAMAELADILTTHAVTAFSAMNIQLEISTPACIEGRDIEITMSSDKVLGIQMLADGIPIDINISFEESQKA